MGTTMKRKILFAFLIAFLASCVSNVVEPEDIKAESSESKDKSSSAKSSGDSKDPSSSSSFAPLPDIDADALEGPTDLLVSSIVRHKTMVLTWTDVGLSRNQYSGYKIYRSTNFTGWDSVEIAPPEQQFFRDNSLDTNAYDFMYKIVAYKTVNKKDSLVSTWSNEAGLLAINDMGFQGVEFDEPEELEIVRWAPSVYELVWDHSGRKPELGFIVQKMGLISEKEWVFPDPGNDILPPNMQHNSDSLLTQEAYWYDQDTLSESNNHLYVHGNNAYGLYRVFAYYSDEFGKMISEFTNEAQTPIAYSPPIVFTAPDLTPQISSNTEIDFSWIPTHKNIKAYTDSLYWELIINEAGTLSTEIIPNSVAGFKTVTVAPANICRVVLTVNLVWKDVHGFVDRIGVTGGSAAGVDSKLKDPGEICKE